MKTIFIISRIILILSPLYLTETSVAQQLISIEEFLDAAGKQSLDLKVERSKLAEIEARADGVRLQPPMFGIMNMKDGGGVNNGIEISQEIPFPTKLSQDLKMRKVDLELQNKVYTGKKAEVLSLARIAFVEFWQVYSKYGILLEKRKWLTEHLGLARASVRADAGTQLHALEMESLIDAVDSELAVSKSDLSQRRQNLKNFAQEIKVDELSPKSIDLVEYKIPSEIKSLQVLVREAELQKTEIGKSLSKQAYLPDLTLRYRGYQGNDMTSKSEELMVGMTLPFLFIWQPRAEVSEMSAKVIAAEAELKKVQIEASLILENSNKKLSSQYQQILTYRDKIIPRAFKRLKLINDLSARTAESLDSRRMIAADFFEARLREIDLRTEYEKTFSETNQKFVYEEKK